MNTFVRMTVIDGEARFRNSNGKYEEFVCRWQDAKTFMEDLLETDEAMEKPTTVKFELIETEKDFETWCLENDVLTDEE